MLQSQKYLRIFTDLTDGSVWQDYLSTLPLLSLMTHHCGRKSKWYNVHLKDQELDIEKEPGKSTEPAAMEKPVEVRELNGSNAERPKRVVSDGLQLEMDPSISVTLGPPTAENQVAKPAESHRFLEEIRTVFSEDGGYNTLSSDVESVASSVVKKSYSNRTISGIRETLKCCFQALGYVWFWHQN